ncbi:hypothetical protein EJ05DRAFT_542303, partial [Pseudovirgaria hyperparasitica]
LPPNHNLLVAKSRWGCKAGSRELGAGAGCLQVFQEDISCSWAQKLDAQTRLTKVSKSAGGKSLRER